MAEIERTDDPADYGGDIVRMIFSPSEDDPHELRKLEVEAVELPRGGWTAVEFNTLRDLQGCPPALGYDWREVVWAKAPRVEDRPDSSQHAEAMDVAAQELEDALVALDAAQERDESHMEIADARREVDRCRRALRLILPDKAALLRREAVEAAGNEEGGM